MVVCSCIICDSIEYTFYKELKNKNDEKYTLVKCDCGFIYLNPRLAESEIADYYNVPNYLPHSNTKNLSNKLYKASQQLTLRWKYRLIGKYKNKINKLLDIGGGQGEFVSFMNKKCISAYNYEPYSNYNSKYLIKDFNDNLRFDIVTLWHSLEHVYDVKSLFDIINNKLDDKGYLIIAIPNYDAFERKKYFKKKWIAYDLPRHLYHFNNNTLNELVKKYGYKIIESHTMFQDTLFNIILSFKGYNIIKLIYIIFTSLIAIILNKKVSSSMVYICKKQL